jgi:hypothetical protein
MLVLYIDDTISILTERLLLFKVVVICGLVFMFIANQSLDFTTSRFSTPPPI